MGLLDRIGSYASPIPAEIRREIAELAGEFTDLQSVDRERLDRYREYREEIGSARESKFSRDATDYGRKPTKDPDLLYRHRFAMPLAQALTVKHAYRIAGRMPDVIVDRRDESMQERHRSSTMERLVWGIIRASKGEQQISSAAWDGSQVGASCFDVYWDDVKQQPIFRAIDPAGVLVVRGVEDPHDFQRVYRFWSVPTRSIRAEYRDVMFRDSESSFADAVEPSERVGTEDYTTVVEVCDKVRCLRFALGSEVPLYERIHGLGYVPYVVIPNLGPDRSIWGWADYEFVRDLVNYLPLLVGRQADIIRAAANGGFINKGTGSSKQQVAAWLREGGVLDAKRDSALEAAPVPQEPAFLPDHAGAVVEFVKMLGFAPDAAWGSAGSTSGADRGLQLMPLIELTAMKQVNWAAGLSRLFGMAFRMIEMNHLMGQSIYRGSVPSATSRASTRFQLILEPGAFDTVENPDLDPMDPEQMLLLPRGPVELFDGDYEVRFNWQNRIDPDDPAFVMSELNKFQQATQSLETTLERLGVQSPQDEIKRIAKEAEEMPWLRAGMIALTKLQLDQASGDASTDGVSPDQGSSMMDALAMMQTPDGSALDVDAGIEGLDGVGVPFGGA